MAAMMYTNKDEQLKRRFRVLSGFPFCEKSILWENTLGWYDQYKKKPFLLKVVLSPILAVKFVCAYSILKSKALYRIITGKSYDDL
jgi:hypothetical protein